LSICGSFSGSSSFEVLTTTSKPGYAEASRLASSGGRLDHQDLVVALALQLGEHGGQDVVGPLDGRQQLVLVRVAELGDALGVEDRGHPDLELAGLDDQARPDDGLEARAGRDVRGDDLGRFGQVVEEQRHRLAHADLHVVGAQRDGVVIERAQGLQGDSVLELGLLETPSGAGGVLDQAAEVDQRERPALALEPLDEVIPADQAAELPPGAPAGFEIPVHLARDHEDGLRPGPVREQLARLARGVAVGDGRTAGRLPAGLRGRQRGPRVVGGGRRGTADVSQERGGRRDRAQRP
jgi:hypothetical protein